MATNSRALADEKFVSLTTFKKDGTGVATPMWLAGDGAELVIWTRAESWKVKRLRRDARVELMPCTRTGKVRDGAEVTTGSAIVDDDPGEVARVEGLIKRKYGLGFHIVTLIERIVAFRSTQARVALRITIPA